MGDTNGGKFKRMLYNLNWVKSKSGNKIENAVEWIILILKKESKQGNTKRVYKTKQRSLSRLKKYGITENIVVDKLKSRGLDDLVKFFVK